MKIALLLFFLMSFQLKAQESTTLFAQCKFEINDRIALDSLQNEIRELPITKLVRLDVVSQRAFILTKGLQELTQEEFISWFGEFSSTVRCIQIGVKGVDQIKRYPFVDCQ